MKFTLNWLREHLDSDASLETIVETLTRVGLEVESVANPAGGWKMYFVNEQHEANYNQLVARYRAERDVEYRVACYIVAVPEIWSKHGGNTGERPFDWTFAPGDDDDNVQRSEGYGWLSGGYRRLVDLGMNLYNSSEFDLCSGLGNWGDECFRIFHQAVHIRINRDVPGVHF